MRILFAFVLAVVPAAAQIPLVSLLNTSHPASDLQIGDRFEIIITAAPKQPVSVRTIRQGRTDWGPVIGLTDSTGRWSADGQFEKQDFGSWREIWTVGGELVSPIIQFSVKAPCLPGGRSSAPPSSTTAQNRHLTTTLLCVARSGHCVLPEDFTRHRQSASTLATLWA
jgi:hypothetical protein